MTRSTLVWAAGLLAMGATAVSSALIWLLVTRPTTVATAAGTKRGNRPPAGTGGVIYEALMGLVRYSSLEYFALGDEHADGSAIEDP